MSAWAGKYVIGLTGNIATGKSVVRKMMEHLGAYGIDADALAHRAIAPGSPGHQPVIDTFGKWILAKDGQIDRGKLGIVVFSDPEALNRLEAVVHPLVGQAVDILVRRSSHRVIVVEAIKLIESGLAAKCDEVWVTYAPPELQMVRLMQRRGMSETQARQRITAQSPQERKIAAAHVVIRNDTTFEETWKQVYSAWLRLFPTAEEAPAEKEQAKQGEMAVERARPRDAQEIADLIARLSEGRRRPSRDDVMAAFGDKAFLLLRMEGRPAGLAGWKVENLVSRTDDIYLEKKIPLPEAMRILIHEVERASKELQCEISLLFLGGDSSNLEQAFTSLGYQKRVIRSLGVRAWEEAAEESMPAGAEMFFKQLRQDRILKPV